MGTGLLEFMNIFTLGRGNPVSMSLLCFYSAATTNLETGLLKQPEQSWAALDTKVNLVPRVFSLFSFPNEKAWGEEEYSRRLETSFDRRPGPIGVGN